MSDTTTKGVWKLQDVRDNILNNQWNSYNFSKTDPGTLFAWGSNVFGELGDGTTIRKSSPVQIPGTTWNDISNGGGNGYHTLARKSDGTLWSWGCNIYGSLGQNNTIDRSSPVQIPGTTWNDISGGLGHSLSRRTDGTLYAWGYNAFGQLANEYFWLKTDLENYLEQRIKNEAKKL